VGQVSVVMAKRKSEINNKIKNSGQECPLHTILLLPI
jgi:hypothetical protein